jgi:hypothetical protein
MHQSRISDSVTVGRRQTILLGSPARYRPLTLRRGNQRLCAPARLPLILPRHARRTLQSAPHRVKLLIRRAPCPTHRRGKAVPLEPTIFRMVSMTADLVGDGGRRARAGDPGIRQRRRPLVAARSSRIPGSGCAAAGRLDPGAPPRAGRVHSLWPLSAPARRRLSAELPLPNRRAAHGRPAGARGRDHRAEPVSAGLGRFYRSRPRKAEADR